MLLRGAWNKSCSESSSENVRDRHMLTFSALGCIGLCGPAMVYISSYMNSFPAWWACYLVSYAIVNGLTYMTPIHISWLWFPEKPGYASGIIMSGYGISALVWNNLALFLVNP